MNDERLSAMVLVNVLFVVIKLGIIPPIFKLAFFNLPKLNSHHDGEENNGNETSEFSRVSQTTATSEAESSEFGIGQRHQSSRMRVREDIEINIGHLQNRYRALEASDDEEV